MELSQAILKGCESTAKRTSAYSNLSGKITETCALGAAIVGLKGVKRAEEVYEYFQHPGREYDDFPILAEHHRCPAGQCSMWDGGGNWAVAAIIPHLNDYHGWSREAIAMWVESIERPAATPEARPAVTRARRAAPQGVGL